jgi:heme exporter protein CcmD
MSQDPHWTYIILAYGVTFLVVGVMTWRIVSDHRRLLAELAKLRRGGEDA